MENIPIQVTEAMNTTLTKDLTLQEIVEVITTLPKGKALEHNGIPIEFFQEYVDEITPTLFTTFKAMLVQGRTSPDSPPSSWLGSR
jgi:hypothetical protein